MPGRPMQRPTAPTHPTPASLPETHDIRPEGRPAGKDKRHAIQKTSLRMRSVSFPKWPIVSTSG
jgi:hypothetical protein